MKLKKQGIQRSQNLGKKNYFIRTDYITLKDGSTLFVY